MPDEVPNLSWFDETDRTCSQCQKRANGILRGSRNESYGPHCRRCAERRLRASQKVREKGAKA